MVDHKGLPVSNFLRTTTLSLYKSVAVLYAYNAPGVLVSFEYAQYNIDVLSTYGAGPFYFFGVNGSDDIKNPSCNFVEVDGLNWISGFLK